MKNLVCFLLIIFSTLSIVSCSHKTEDTVAKDFLSALLQGNDNEAFNMTAQALDPKKKEYENMKDFLSYIADNINEIETKDESLLKSITIIKITDAINIHYDKVIEVDCIFTNENKITIEVYLTNLYGKWYVYNLDIL